MDPNTPLAVPERTMQPDALLPPTGSIRIRRPLPPAIVAYPVIFWALAVAGYGSSSHDSTGSTVSSSSTGSALTYTSLLKGATSGIKDRAQPDPKRTEHPRGSHQW